MHRALVLTPTIGGVSTITFMSEIMATVFVFNMFRLSLLTPICILAIWLGLHPLLRSIEKDDPKALINWLEWLLAGQPYYPPNSSISRTPEKSKRSIPKIK